jgi:ElaB/YqjD/DUF883 family membrane-anchored ribosome-binding protein
MATSSANLPFPTSTGSPADGLDGGTSAQNTSASTNGGSSGDDLLGRVVKGAHDTIDRLADTAAPHVHRLQEGMAHANDSLHSRADHVREVGDEWADSLRTTVREHPLAAVATALALGMLISRISR